MDLQKKIHRSLRILDGKLLLQVNKRKRKGGKKSTSNNFKLMYKSILLTKSSITMIIKPSSYQTSKTKDSGGSVERG